MYFSLSALSLLCLLNVCTAYPQENHATRTISNTTLFRRIGSPPVTTDIFSIGDASTAGGCASQVTTTDAWIAETVLLHNAMTTAYDNYRTDPGTRLLFTALMGVHFEDDGGDIYIDDFSDSLWGSIGERLDEVSQFLSGGGLNNALTSKPPWIFCSGDFAEIAPWDQPVMDNKGEPVEYPSGEATGYVKLADVFPEYTQTVAYYITPLLGYLFRITRYKLLCDPTLGSYAWTTKRSTTSANGAVSVSTYDRFAWFCPRSFDPLGQAMPSEVHSVSLLATSITPAGYPTIPTDGTRPKALDEYVPLSGTFYHELIHLTDSAQTTRDPYYDLGKATQAAIERQSDISTNPESFVLFAMAAYIYQNPPAGASAILFLDAGLPQIASVAISRAAAGN